MCPLPVVPGLTCVQRISQLPSGPPRLGETVRSLRSLTLIVATSVRPGPLASEAPVRSRLADAGVLVPLWERSASPAGSLTEPIGTPGPLPWVADALDASRLGPLIWRLTTT